jgi:hypothetical protein
MECVQAGRAICAPPDREGMSIAHAIERKSARALVRAATGVTPGVVAGMGVSMECARAAWWAPVATKFGVRALNRA